MVALVERTAAVVPLPRARFTALVVAESAARRQNLVGRLRLLGAREVIEAASGAEARVRAHHEGQRDLVVIEGGLSDGPALPLLGDLRNLGWRRVVLLTVRDDPYAVRAAINAGVRCYVVTPEDNPASTTAPASVRPATTMPQPSDPAALVAGGSTATTMRCGTAPSPRRNMSRVHNAPGKSSISSPSSSCRPSTVPR